MNVLFIIVVNVLHVSVLFCDHHQGAVFFSKKCITKATKPMYNYKIINFKFVIGVVYLLYMLYFKMSCIFLWLVVLCILLSSYVYLLYNS